MLYAEKEPREKRGRLIAIRLSQCEHDQLGRIAAERGGGVSTLVRERILALLSSAGGSTPATPPCGTLGDVPRGSWKEEFEALAARAAALEAHRKRVSAMLATTKVPMGFREWPPEKRAEWLDQNCPIKPERAR